MSLNALLATPIDPKSGRNRKRAKRVGEKANVRIQLTADESTLMRTKAAGEGLSTNAWVQKELDAWLESMINSTFNPYDFNIRDTGRAEGHSFRITKSSKDNIEKTVASGLIPTTRIIRALLIRALVEQNCINTPK